MQTPTDVRGLNTIKEMCFEAQPPSTPRQCAVTPSLYIHLHESEIKATICLSGRGYLSENQPQVSNISSAWTSLQAAANGFHLLPVWKWGARFLTRSNFAIYFNEHLVWSHLCQTSKRLLSIRFSAINFSARPVKQSPEWRIKEAEWASEGPITAETVGSAHNTD